MIFTKFTPLKEYSKGKEKICPRLSGEPVNPNQSLSSFLVCEPSISASARRPQSRKWQISAGHPVTPPHSHHTAAKYDDLPLLNSVTPCRANNPMTATALERQKTAPMLVNVGTQHLENLKKPEGSDDPLAFMTRPTILTSCRERRRRSA